MGGLPLNAYDDKPETKPPEPVVETKKEEPVLEPAPPPPPEPEPVKEPEPVQEEPAPASAAPAEPKKEDGAEKKDFRFEVTVDKGSGSKKLGLETMTFPKDSVLRVHKLKPAGLM